MNNSVQFIKKVWVFALLVLFIGYAASTTFFLHSHYVKGQWVTHSHPYSELPDSGKHTHTPAQYVAIATLTSFVMLAITLVYLFRPFLSEYQLLAKLLLQFHSVKKPSTLSLRGPPATVSFSLLPFRE